MNDLIFDNFQNDVAELLLRHKSILDVMTKYNESSSKVNRAIAKTITECGCLKISANEQNSKNDEFFSNCQDPHVKGSLCENCRYVIEKELGNNLFYTAALCNTVDINLFDVLLKESNKLKTLGKYNLK